jgi:hypothetical protein
MADDTRAGQVSQYLDYLPGIYQGGSEPGKPNFLGRFLLAFEQLLTGLGDQAVDAQGNALRAGLEELLDGIADPDRPGAYLLAGSERYFEPGPDLDPTQRAPADFLPWLAGWVALTEIVRGVLARQRVHRENIFASTWQLFNRNPRRYGGYMIHFGMTVIGLGVIGSTLFQLETQRTLAVGDAFDIGGYTMRSDGLLSGQVAEDGRLMDIARVTLLRNGAELAHLRPRRDFYPEATASNSMTIAGSHSTIENDFYVLLVNWEPINQNQATFKVYINPLINWIWTGGLILIVGTFLAAYPKDAVAERARKSVAAPQPGQLARKGA